MKVHAETMRAHAAKLGSGIAGLAF